MNITRLSVDPLHTLNRKLILVGDLVVGVATGHKHGLYLHGDGGVGKSYTVLEKLEELGVKFILLNSRITAKGLFLALGKSPDAIFVLEDVERLTKDPDAQGVLRSALWAQPGQERIVNWVTSVEGAEPFAFRGGIILISNKPMSDLPELRALATRIEVYRLELTAAELEAKVRQLADQGYRRDGKLLIEPTQAIEITEHVLAECLTAGCRLDLRLQQKAFQTYLQWAADLAQTHWKDLVTASVHQAMQCFRHEANTLSIEDKRAWRRQVVREILATIREPEKQFEAYKQRTGTERADYYRRKREVESGEFEGETPPSEP